MTNPPLYLRFYATQNEPDFMTIFMEGGGAINSAATRWDTDFAVTGSEESTRAALDPRQLHEVSIKIPTKEILSQKDGEDGSDRCVSLSNKFRLNAATSRIGAAINGTLVSSVSGQGTEHVINLLTAMGDKHGLTGRTGHAQIGLVYASWMAHAASIGISNARIVGVDATGGDEVVYDVQFDEPSEELKVALEKSAKWVEKYVQKAWAVRQALAYPPSPTLTKAVFKESVGVNGQGFSLLHDALFRHSPLAPDALESLFSATIASVLEDSTHLADFFTATMTRGLQAAEMASEVATATSLAVSHMVAYRSDGRNVVTAMGADFAAAESWLHQTQRSHIEANDCDGSALLAIGMLRSVLEMKDIDEEVKDADAGANADADADANDPEPKYRYKTLRSIRNVLDPYYHVGIAVVGAMSAEASTLQEVDDDHEPTVAGHAIALMVPSLGLLRGLAKANGRTLGNTSQQIVAQNTADVVENTRFNALFPKEVVARLPPADQVLLKHGWKHYTESEDADSKTDKLRVLAIEGTTPSEARLYQPDTAKRTQQEKAAEKDDVAFAKVAPNVFRSVKCMHVGGGKAGSTHRFYRDIVEVTFARDFPLYQSKKVRTVGAAATQYVFAREVQADNIKLRIAGASPKDLHENAFVVVPLIQLGNEVASELDKASVEAWQDVLPPRPRGPMQLTPIQSGSYYASCEALTKLNDHFSDASYDAAACEAHTVTYQVAYSTLVHNPSAVEQFCGVLKKTAVAVQVKQVPLHAFAQTNDKKNAGVFVSINACIPV